MFEGVYDLVYGQPHQASDEAEMENNATIQIWLKAHKIDLLILSMEFKLTYTVVLMWNSYGKYNTVGISSLNSWKKNFSHSLQQ